MNEMSMTPNGLELTFDGQTHPVRSISAIFEDIRYLRTIARYSLSVVGDRHGDVWPSPALDFDYASAGTLPEGWWHCDCGADNDPNVSPLRCGICRRFK
jgi:hypothetical protein